jgi:hypothetical protein
MPAAATRRAVADGGAKGGPSRNVASWTATSPGIYLIVKGFKPSLILYDAGATPG